MKCLVVGGPCDGQHVEQPGNERPVPVVTLYPTQHFGEHRPIQGVQYVRHEFAANAECAYIYAPGHLHDMEIMNALLAAYKRSRPFTEEEIHSTLMVFRERLEHNMRLDVSCASPGHQAMRSALTALYEKRSKS